MSGRRDPGYEVVVGLEVHVQLATRTKCFCPCEARFGSPPNTHVCPVCTGLPGALPVLNREVVDQALRAGLALGCEVAARTRWERKAYFYPDLPKGFQITQQHAPLCTGGRLAFEGPAGESSLRIERAHIEEDAARCVEAGDGTVLLDFNRAGVPLLEIVTAPELGGAETASAALVELARLLRHLGVSDCAMERGELRAEPNVSVLVPTPQGPLGSAPVEVKNVNSFAGVRAAIEYEAARQAHELTCHGETGVGGRETRGWDAATGRTRPLRSKESAADYRHFTEPDLPPVTAARHRAETLRETLPELPLARQRRFERALGLPAAKSRALLEDRVRADFFERVAATCGDARAAANWMLNDVLRLARERGGSIAELPLEADELGGLVAAVERGEVPADGARKHVLPEMLARGCSWRAAAAALEAVAEPALRAVVSDVLAAEAELVTAYRGGKRQVLEALLGAVLRRAGGGADARSARSILRAGLDRTEDAEAGSAP